MTMKEMVIDISELTDSAEVYKRRPHRALLYFIYGSLAIFLFASVAACLWKLRIETTTYGLVEPQSDAQSIVCLQPGRIQTINCVNGQTVRKGDVLFTLDTTEIDQSICELEKEKQRYHQQERFLLTFIEGLRDTENPFCSATNSEEYPYYLQFLLYRTSLPQKSLLPYTEEDQKETVELAAIEKEVELITKLEETRNSLLSTNEQINRLMEKKELFSIKASCSGTISMYTQLSIGDYISLGTKIGFVYLKDSNYRVFLYVSASDIAGIKVGDRVKYYNQAQNSSRIKNAAGEVLSIVPEANVESNQLGYLYAVECSITIPDSTSSEIDASIFIGMQLNASIVTQEETIMQYLLNRLNIL